MAIAMKKRMMSLLLLGMVGSMLTGCGKAIPEMTEEQHKLVVQYAADVLLKYDKNYQKNSGIVDPDKLAQADQKPDIPEIPIVEENVLPDEPVIPSDPGFIDADKVEESGGVCSMAQMLGYPEFSIEYAGYEITQSHSTDEYVSMDAAEGKVLILFHFDVTNQGTTEAELNIRDINTRFRIFINHGKQNNTLATWLPDDLSKFKGSFAAGETKDLVLVIEVNEDTISENFDTLQLILKLEEESLTINLE